MVKITILDIDEGELVSSEEIDSTIRNCSQDNFGLLQTPDSKPIGGAFAHVGAIGPLGRESFQKFSAVFDPNPYPGSNCGISILGAGSISNLRKLLREP